MKNLELSLLDINDLSKAVIKNTKDLLNTAEILLKMEKNGHAGFFCILAHEELIKYFLLSQLVGTMFLREPNWKNFWKAFKDHIYKLEMHAAYDFLFCFNSEKPPSFAWLAMLLEFVKVMYNFLGSDQRKLDVLNEKIQKQSISSRFLFYQLLRSIIPILKIYRENFIYIGMRNNCINTPFAHETLPPEFVRKTLDFLEIKCEYVYNFHNEFGEDFICNLKIEEKDNFLKWNTLSPGFNVYEKLPF